MITLVECPYFKTNLHHLSSGDGVETTLTTNGRFHMLTCVSGEVTVTGENGSVALTTGVSALLPAAAGRYSLTGSGDVLRSWQGA